MSDPNSRTNDHARLLAIVQELQGLADELGSIDSESAALMKRSLDTALRAAPTPAKPREA